MHKGHFQVERGMAVMGGKRQSICLLRYICHKEASYVHQTDSDILGSEYHLVEAKTR